MASKRKRGRDDPSTPNASPIAEIPTAAAIPSTRENEDKGVKRMLNKIMELTVSISEAQKQTHKRLKKLTESHNEHKKHTSKMHKQMHKQLQELTESHDRHKEYTSEMHKKTHKQLQEIIESHEGHKEGSSERQRQLHTKLQELTERHNELWKHNNSSSGDDSAAPRPQSTQVRPPRYRLKFTCEVNDPIKEGHIIETKNQGKNLSVALFDDDKEIAENDPLASAQVKLVVVKREFNKDCTQCDWTREDFNESIDKKIGDVTNGCFKLDGGVKNHTGAIIMRNSSNKKVKLGVMVVSPEDADVRVVEGLSNLFLVRSKDAEKQKKNPEKQKKVLGGNDDQDRNGQNLLYTSQNQLYPFQNLPYPMQNLSRALLAGAPSELYLPPAEVNPVAARTQLPANTIAQNMEPSTSQLPPSVPQDQTSQHTMYGIAQGNGREIYPMVNQQNQAWAGSTQTMGNFSADTDSASHNCSVNHNVYAGYDYNTRTFPVQLLWDRSVVEPRKRWNLLDQLMPLYSTQPKIHPGDFIQPKEVVQTSRNRGVLIQLLEPDDSDERRPPKRELHNDYRLRFVNKVFDVYYTRENIKADDGNPLKVALYDEDNIKITSGPLSSAPVEVVVLHGDFNVDGQDDWTPEEFNGSVVCPQTQSEEPALGGDRILALGDGEASLGDIFFQMTSVRARTGMFKMGVMLSGTQDERVQQGISEPFLVWNRRGKGTKAIRKPLLAGGVCQITNINSNGDYHKALLSNGIHTVRDFLKHLVMDEQKLRSILPNVSDFTWEDIVGHAKRTDIGNQLYSFNCPDQDVVLFFNSVYQLVGAKSGRHYKGVKEFTPFEEAFVEKLKVIAYENKESMKYDHMMVANSPVTRYESMHCEGMNSASIPGSKITFLESSRHASSLIRSQIENTSIGRGLSGYSYSTSVPYKNKESMHCEGTNIASIPRSNNTYPETSSYASWFVRQYSYPQTNPFKFRGVNKGSISLRRWRKAMNTIMFVHRLKSESTTSHLLSMFSSQYYYSQANPFQLRGGNKGSISLRRWHKAINAIVFLHTLKSESTTSHFLSRLSNPFQLRGANTGYIFLRRWRAAINAIIFIRTLKSENSRSHLLPRFASQYCYSQTNPFELRGGNTGSIFLLRTAINAIIFLGRLKSKSTNSHLIYRFASRYPYSQKNWFRLRGGNTCSRFLHRWRAAINAIMFLHRLKSKSTMSRFLSRFGSQYYYSRRGGNTGSIFLHRWRAAIDTIIFLHRLKSDSIMTHLLSRFALQYSFLANKSFSASRWKYRLYFSSALARSYKRHHFLHGLKSESPMTHLLSRP